MSFTPGPWEVIGRTDVVAAHEGIPMYREHDCTGPDHCLHCATRAAIAKAQGRQLAKAAEPA